MNHSQEDIINEYTDDIDHDYSPPSRPLPGRPLSIDRGLEINTNPNTTDSEWTDGIEEFLINTNTKLTEYSNIHQKTATLYNTIFRSISFTVMILSTLMSGETILPSISNLYNKLTITNKVMIDLKNCMLYLISFCGIVSNFFKFEDKRQKHKETSAKFREISGEITLLLCTSKNHRDPEAVKLVGVLLIKINCLISDSPDIPLVFSESKLKSKQLLLMPN